MPDPRPNNPNMPSEPPRPDPTKPSENKPKRRRLVVRIKRMISWVKIDTGIALGIFVLTAVLVWLTWLLIPHHTGKPAAPIVETRIIDANVPAKDVRVIVRPPEGTAAKDFQVKPLGLTVKATDAYGECSFDDTSRGCSADLFDAAGRFLATIILPSAGHLEVKITMPEPTKG